MSGRVNVMITTSHVQVGLVDQYIIHFPTTIKHEYWNLPDYSKELAHIVGLTEGAT